MKKRIRRPKKSSVSEIDRKPPELYPTCPIDSELVKKKSILPEELDALTLLRSFRSKLRSTNYNLTKENVNVKIPEIILSEKYFPSELINGVRVRKSPLDVNVSMKNFDEEEENARLSPEIEDDDDGMADFAHLMHSQDDELYGDDETTEKETHGNEMKDMENLII